MRQCSTSHMSCIVWSSLVSIRFVLVRPGDDFGQTRARRGSHRGEIVRLTFSRPIVKGSLRSDLLASGLWPSILDVSLLIAIPLERCVDVGGKQNEGGG